MSACALSITAGSRVVFSLNGSQHEATVGAITSTGQLVLGNGLVIDSESVRCVIRGKQ